jgi:hypothetical protein
MRQPCAAGTSSFSMGAPSCDPGPVPSQRRLSQILHRLPGSSPSAVRVPRRSSSCRTSRPSARPSTTSEWWCRCLQHGSICGHPAATTTRADFRHSRLTRSLSARTSVDRYAGSGARRMLFDGRTLRDPCSSCHYGFASRTRSSRALYRLVWPLGKLEELVLRLQDHWRTVRLISTHSDLATSSERSSSRTSNGSKRLFTQ